MKKIEELVSIFEGYDAKVYGIDISPVLVYLIGNRLKQRGVHNNQRFCAIDCIFRSILLLKSIVGYLSILCIRSKTTLFVSSENNFSDIDGVLYDKVVDPLYIKDKKCAIKLVFSSYIKSGMKAYPNQWNISYIIYAFSMPVYIYLKLFARFNHEVVKSGKLLCEASKFFDLKAPNYLRALSIILSGKILFSLLLRMTNIRKIFVSNAYSLDTISLIIAGNIIGAKTYSIQHGVQEKGHYAFSFTSNYLHKNTLPYKYLCWDEFSTNTIRKFAKTKIMGYQWFEFVRSIYSDKITFCNDGFEKTVLVTTQPTTGIMIEEIRAMILNNPDTYFFYRLHPSQISDESFNELEMFLQGIKNVDYLDASKLALPILLNESNIHMTGFSSTTLEAFFAKIPTILFHKKGIEYYKAIMNQDVKVVYVPLKLIPDYSLNGVI